MLQRIYGTAFSDKKVLAEFIKQREEAEKRDHRKLGKELGLFTFHPLAPGARVLDCRRAPCSTPRCRRSMRRLLLDEPATSRSRRRCSINQKLWETSGHWQHYAENMFKVRVRGAGVLASSR